jgi:hypothetical protein
MALQSTSRDPGHRCGFEELAAIFAQIYVAAEQRSGGNSLTPGRREGKPSRGWVFRFERRGRERGKWLGSYPELSLAQASEIRDKSSASCYARVRIRILAYFRPGLAGLWMGGLSMECDYVDRTEAAEKRYAGGKKRGPREMGVVAI